MNHSKTDIFNPKKCTKCGKLMINQPAQMSMTRDDFEKLRKGEVIQNFEPKYYCEDCAQPIL